jgi:poly(3-hydroxybutyrate) depolymerase
MSVLNKRVRRHVLALVAVGFAAAAAVWAMYGQANASAATLPGQLTSGTYTNSAGALGYELYVPSTYRAGTTAPLVVALHGCTENADVYRQLSGWDALAEAKGFIVLFPQQSSSRNSQDCWNWFVPADMQRGSGEPAIITGMVTRLSRTTRSTRSECTLPDSPPVARWRT